VVLTGTRGNAQPGRGGNRDGDPCEAPAEPGKPEQGMEAKQSPAAQSWSKSEELGWM